MTINESILIDMIRDCKYPDKALLIAIQTILSILTQH